MHVCHHGFINHDDIPTSWHHKSLEHNWKSAQVVNSHLVCDPTIRQLGFDLPRQQWSLLNRFRTEQGHCGACRRKWRLTDLCVSCICVLVARPRRCLTLSNPVPWQNWMAAYLGYTLQMRTLFRGWPVMVNDTHTRRRRRLTINCRSFRRPVLTWKNVSSWISSVDVCVSANSRTFASNLSTSLTRAFISTLDGIFCKHNII